MIPQMGTCSPFSTVMVLLSSRCDCFPVDNAVPCTPGLWSRDKHLPLFLPSWQPCIQSTSYRVSCTGCEVGMSPCMNIVYAHKYSDITCKGNSDLNGCSKRSPVDIIYLSGPNGQTLKIITAWPIGTGDSKGKTIKDSLRRLWIQLQNTSKQIKSDSPVETSQKWGRQQ